MTPQPLPDAIAPSAALAELRVFLRDLEPVVRKEDR
jgi:hypothetical protein